MHLTSTAIDLREDLEERVPPKVLGRTALVLCGAATGSPPVSHIGDTIRVRNISTRRGAERKRGPQFKPQARPGRSSGQQACRARCTASAAGRRLPGAGLDKGRALILRPSVALPFELYRCKTGF